jgi:peptidoglycan/xylan/chitin deacetylase (PgdA/CDA1 family)
VNGGCRRVAHRAVDVLVGARLGSIVRVKTTEPVVAMTFDDGPDREWTPRIVDILASQRAFATFFMLLESARRHPELVRRVVAGGHEVGLHGVDHRSLAGRSRRSTRSLLDAAAVELATISGAPVRYFRPPFGAQTIASFLGARDAGLECVVWDVDSHDWRGGDERYTATQVVAQAVPGSIVLLHDGLAGDAQRGFDRARHVQLVVDGLRRRSLRSTTFSDMLACGKAWRTVWLRRHAFARDREVQWTRS